MRYLPKSPKDREEMLAEIGVASIDDLFATIPAEYQLKRDLAVPRQHGESEIIDRFRGLRRTMRPGMRAFWARALSALQAGDYRLAGAARGVSDELYAVSAGDLAGHAAGDVRVPDDDLRADRDGDRERVDV
jgi:hypothetical protein